MSMMKISRLFGLMALMLVAGCGAPKDDWFGEYGTAPAGTPANIYGEFESNPALPDNINAADTRRMAVLLPMTGNGADVGRAIRTSIETAVLARGPNNLAVAFYDTADADAIAQALGGAPEIVIGPLFAAQARAIRDIKPADLPVLTFTSDATAVGGGVMTMTLMPTNSVEAIVKEMSADGVRRLMVLGPDTETGHLMAGVAKNAAGIYDIDLSGIFYYTEGNAESIKNVTADATLYKARSAANTRAREILADILTKESLDTAEKSSLNRQLAKVSKDDTLGAVPYDAVLFLGSAADTRSLVSFLRYYGVGARDVKLYGTAVWDGTDAAGDVSLAGAKFATLPEMSGGFVNLYDFMAGGAPHHLAAFGYDAANIAMGMLYSGKSNAAYLLDPSGFVGVDGLVRLRPTGESERGLRIVALDGSGSLRPVRDAPKNFITPVYNIEQRHIVPAPAKNFDVRTVNALDYITVPARFQAKYSGKKSAPAVSQPAQAPVVTRVAADDGAAVVADGFKPVRPESVGRTIIDSVEIEEE